MCGCDVGWIVLEGCACVRVCVCVGSEGFIFSACMYVCSFCAVLVFMKKKKQHVPLDTCHNMTLRTIGLSISAVVIWRESGAVFFVFF